MITVRVSEYGTLLASTEHEPIYITSVSDFEALGVQGDGSINDPYLITDLTITSMGSAAIVVWNVSTNYVISDCVVTGPLYRPSALIVLVGEGNGSIVNCSISNSEVGVLLDEFIGNISIIGNSFSDISYASVWSIQSKLSIYDNHFIIDGSSTTGLFIDNNEISNIENNHFEIYEGTGVMLNTTSNVDIQSCSFIGHDASSTSIRQTYNQEYTSHVSNLIIRQSLFDGVINEIANYGNQVTNITIEDCTIISGPGIDIGADAQGEIYLTNNTVINAGIGVFLNSETGGTIEHNTISSCEVGISLYSNNSIIYDNIVSSCGVGIFVKGDESSIHNNTITNNTRGIDITGDSNQVYYNHFTNNDEDAFDYGQYNKWDDDVSLGNYWDTPSTDGVHPILGDSSSVDRYPIYIPLLNDNSVVMVLLSVASVGLVVLILGILFKKQS
ncbi:MAG: NosD domain-containing protein [Candidatus Thorarchaeota archaeon]